MGSEGFLNIHPIIRLFIGWLGVDIQIAPEFAIAWAWFARLVWVPEPCSPILLYFLRKWDMGDYTVLGNIITGLKWFVNRK